MSSSTDLSVRLATHADIPRIMEIFEAAKRFMRANGNMVQWTGAYPSIELIESQIANSYCHVVESEPGEIHGLFCLVDGDDPTYEYIEGAWKHSGPYSTLHRIASDGSRSGIFNIAIEFSKTQCSQLRIDTHADNSKMLSAIEKAGFEYCGVIYVADGTPRHAYSMICS